ncbi:MAG TPA: DUF924 family protein [Polyangiales bacterium]|nr:DUF924 family protein [Polyangiales bacterium]
MSDIDQVLSFWLEPKPDTEEALAARYQYWFYGGEPVDREVRARFATLVERARRGELDDWTSTPRGTLALIILIDQFCRNLYRGTPDAFSHDGKALALARAGFDDGRFAALDELDRLFAAMPFRHAEDIEAQKRGVDLAVKDALSGRPAWRKMLIESVDYARKHLDVIVRLGRFPGRNAALRRATTAQEQEYFEYLKLAGQWL